MTRTRLFTLQQDLDFMYELNINVVSDQKDLQDQLTASKKANGVLNGQPDDALTAMYILGKCPEPKQ